MKSLLTLISILILSSSMAQVKKEKVPSYFGFQVRPIFPTRFIGDPVLELNKDGYYTKLSQKLGYSFGGTVRAGITKLIALETGINFNERHFDLEMSYADSNSYATDDLTFIEYDIPINGLVYIRLADQWYMNASLGVAMTFKPTDVRVVNKPGGYHYYSHIGLVDRKTGFALNANVGFELRTKKSGFFYIGGSGRVPFTPLFNLIADYSYQSANEIRVIGEVDGSFLSIDFKYFFPNIKNKGQQFQDGPIE